MDEKIQELQERIASTTAGMEAIVNRAKAENDRDLTDEEVLQLKESEVEISKLEQKVDALQSVKVQKDRFSQSSRKTEPAPVGEPDRRGGAQGLGGGRPAGDPARIPAEIKEGKAGFKMFGEYALAVKNACRGGGDVDARLRSLAPSNYMNEGSGADGGFAVPPDFRTEIVSRIMGEDSLLSLTDQLTTSSNSITIPVDDSAPWDQTGIRAYWEGEGSQLRNSKPNLKDQAVKLHKLSALVFVTDELLEDAPSLSAFIRRKAPEAMTWKINDAILFGTGVGMPQGIVTSTAKVQVAKDAGQPADTITYSNLSNMWARLHGPSRQRARWVTNQDVEPQFDQMTVPAAVSGQQGYPVYVPAGVGANNSSGLIRGRPMLPLENTKPLGDEGDIVLADFSKYLTVTKGTGIKQDMSIHLLFDYDMTAFRFIFRMGGQPWWPKPLTRANSNNQLSSFVTLQDRA